MITLHSYDYKGFFAAGNVFSVWYSKSLTKRSTLSLIAGGGGDASCLERVHHFLGVTSIFSTIIFTQYKIATQGKSLI